MTCRLASKGTILASARALIFGEGGIPAYFTLAILLFIAAFLLLPTAKMVNNYYYAFIAAPALAALFRLRGKLDLRQPGILLWGVLFAWCALSGTVQYAKHLFYVALFLLAVMRLAATGIFRTGMFARAMFWTVLGYIFISVAVYWLNGEYELGQRVALLIGRLNGCIYVSIWLAACLVLAFPFWFAGGRWTEMALAIPLSLIAIIYVLQSRSGLLSLCVVPVFILGYVWHKRRAARYVAAAFAVFIMAVSFVLWLDPSLHEIVFRGDSGRFELWQKLMLDWKQCSPWLGCGTGFRSAHTILDGALPILHPHNIFFAFAFYNGLPALFIFFALCAHLLYTAWRARDPWGGYLLSAMIGLNFEGGQVIGNPDALWLLILLPMALIACSRREKTPDGAAPAPA
ncbi:MAG: O-antigen ligase family protein [Azoarcus sp.]|jgi:O-antigen ligase|nr:O-antigen ligase family protein [Azoarcus sp.]